jgi:hypothetical protein
MCSSSVRTAITGIVEATTRRSVLSIYRIERLGLGWRRGADTRVRRAETRRQLPLTAALVETTLDVAAER